MSNNPQMVSAVRNTSVSTTPSKNTNAEFYCSACGQKWSPQRETWSPHCERHLADHIGPLKDSERPIYLPTVPVSTPFSARMTQISFGVAFLALLSIYLLHHFVSPLFK